MNRRLSSRRYEALKRIAADFIEDYELVYPLEPWVIADLLDVRVVIHAHWSRELAAHCGSEDGYTKRLACANGFKFIVHVNSAAPPLRQRFTVMHELSHILLDHLLGIEAPCSDVAEAEANFLASYLLAPDVLVMEWVPELTISGISREFEVSGEAGRLIRARVLRVINRKAPSRGREERILGAARRRFAESCEAQLSIWLGSA